MTNPEEYPYDAAMVERRVDSTNDHSIRIALLEQGMKNITSELHSINSNIAKLILLAIAAIGTSFIQCILRGGLA